MPIIRFQNNQTNNENAYKSLRQLLSEVAEHEKIKLYCNDFPNYSKANPTNEYGYWHIVVTKSAPELEEAWKKLVAKVRDKKLWKVEVVTSADAIGFSVYVPYYIDELIKKAAFDHLKECLPLNSTNRASDTIAFGIYTNEANKYGLKTIVTSNTTDQSDISLESFMPIQDAAKVISFNINLVKRILLNTNNGQNDLYVELNRIENRLLFKLKNPNLQPVMTEQQLIDISKVALDLTQLMEQYNLAIKQERSTHNAIFRLHSALITRLADAVSGNSSEEDFKKLNDYLEIAKLPVQLRQSLNMLDTRLDDQRALYNSLEALQVELISQAAAAVSRGNVADMQYLGSVRASADNVVNTLLDNNVLPDDKINAIHQFEKLAKARTPIWQSIAKLAGAVIITAVTCAIVAAASGALGLGIGFALGAWSGPGAMFTALAGLLKGTITGAALGAAIGISATTSILGVATFSVTTYNMFKPVKPAIIFSLRSSQFSKAARMVSPADEEQRPLMKSAI